MGGPTQKDEPLELPPHLEAGEYRRLIADATDERIGAAVAANRGELLHELFLRRMPEHFDPAKAEGIDATLEWRVLGGADLPADRFQVCIRGGHCTVQEGGTEKPDVILEITPAALLKMLVGLIEPIRLFTLGKVKVEGDLMLAARAPGFFRFPT